MALRSAAAVAALFVLAVANVNASDNVITLIAKYPDGNLDPGVTLTVRGNCSGLNWNTGVPAEHVEANTWSLTVPYSAADAGSALAFKLLVDDNMWSVGSNEEVVLPAGNGTVYTVYPWFATSQGRYEYIRGVASPKLGNRRDVVVYLPPSYDENTLKPYHNIILMHDGQNLFNVSTSAFGVAWMCQDTVDELVVEGAMSEVIIVGVDNAGAARTDEYTYSYDKTVGAGGKGDVYLDFLQDMVKPLILSKYSRIANSGPWAMIGSSLGGLLSCYAGWTRIQEWNVVGCMSSSFWWNSQDFNNTILQRPRPASPLTVYLDSGDSGPDNDDETQTLAVRAHFESLGYSPYYYLDHGGQHNEKYWGARFHVPMKDLFSPVPGQAVAST